MDQPCIVFSAGEPAGIGPDVCLSIAGSAWPARLAVVADADLLAKRSDELKLDVRIRRIDAPASAPAHDPGSLCVVHVPLHAPARAGQLDPLNAAAVLRVLDLCADACLAGDAAAMVTAPLHKGIINDAGIPFSGHTEYLARRTGARQPVMMLCAGTLRVALATTHLPLSAVPAAVTASRLDRVLRTVHHDLGRWFGIASPTIGVCGLNPHAGEGGHLGHEEQTVIEPVLERARADGINALGPLPADTAFTPRILDTVDAILAMYHDQGLPVLKYAGFGASINITLGLPIIRTSVDHGTALDLAGSGRADDGSLRAALALAIDLANNSARV
jgi:4-hydroxythreonine-4-phosphate dehydrogenase